MRKGRPHMEELKKLAAECLETRTILYKEDAKELAKQALLYLKAHTSQDKVTISKGKGHFQINGKETDIVYHYPIWKFLEEIICNLDGYLAKFYPEEDDGWERLSISVQL